jgi:hypothetical protein
MEVGSADRGRQLHDALQLDHDGRPSAPGLLTTDQQEPAQPPTSAPTFGRAWRMRSVSAVSSSPRSACETGFEGRASANRRHGASFHHPRPYRAQLPGTTEDVGRRVPFES